MQIIGLKKTIKFRADLGFNQINLILKEEQSVVIPLLIAFSAEKYNYNTKSQKMKKKELVCIFLSIKEQQKLTKRDILVDIKMNKTKDK